MRRRDYRLILYPFIDMIIIVGKILKAQGIKGDIKIACMLDSADQLVDIDSVYIDGVTYGIQNIRVMPNNYAIMKLDLINDRNGAELLVGKNVLADRDKIILPEGRYFVDDLLQCTVTLDDNTEVGTLVAISPCVSADIYTVEDNNGKSVQFPFLNDLIVNIDTDNKRIVLSKKRFLEVSLYED